MKGEHREKLGKILRQISEILLQLVYPERCVFCDRTVDPHENFVCRSCVGKAVKTSEPRCMKCGKQLSKEDAEFCGDCKRFHHFFDRGFSLYHYNESVRKSIYRLKYKNRRRYAFFYGEKIAAEFKDFLKECRADALIPVPLNRERQQKRGYNQAALIAGEVGRRTGIPVREDLVVRVKNTGALKLLGADDRRAVLKNAFKITSDDVKLKTAILIDDIYTTGSTVDEIASLLKSKGVERVYFLTIAGGGSSS